VKYQRNEFSSLIEHLKNEVVYDGGTDIQSIKFPEGVFLLLLGNFAKAFIFNNYSLQFRLQQNFVVHRWI
jgi:hypothetical protein